MSLESETLTKCHAKRKPHRSDTATQAWFGHSGVDRRMLVEASELHINSYGAHVESGR